jgi:hypothetical protein
MNIIFSIAFLQLVLLLWLSILHGSKNTTLFTFCYFYDKLFHLIFKGSLCPEVFLFLTSYLFLVSCYCFQKLTHWPVSWTIFCFCWFFDKE